MGNNAKIFSAAGFTARGICSFLEVKDSPPGFHKYRLENITILARDHQNGPLILEISMWRCPMEGCRMVFVDTGASDTRASDV